MTIEEAIRILDPETSQEAIAGYGPEEAQRIAISQALGMAISALRAQHPRSLDRSRWEECEFCDKYGLVLAAFDGWSYCNRCGCPLTEEAWVELERRIGNG